MDKRKGLEKYLAFYIDSEIIVQLYSSPINEQSYPLRQTNEPTLIVQKQQQSF